MKFIVQIISRVLILIFYFLFVKVSFYFYVMESDVIFGSSIRLPSIEGVESGCEEELYLLMREVDLAFQRKHKDILSEVKELRASCKEKKDEIEHWKAVVASRKQKSQSTTDEHTKLLLKDMAKLKEENARLKNENSSLQTKIRRVSEIESQLESVKKSLIVQQEENIILKDRTRKLSEQHSILQENYQKLLNVMALERKDGSGDHTQPQQSTLPNFVNDLIAQEIENCLKEETELSNKFQAEINAVIEQSQIPQNEQK